MVCVFPSPKGVTFQIDTLFGERANGSHINSIAVLDDARG